MFMKYGFNNLIYNLKNQNSKITPLKQAGDLVTCSTSDSGDSLYLDTKRYLSIYTERPACPRLVSLDSSCSCLFLFAITFTIYISMTICN